VPVVILDLFEDSEQGSGAATPSRDDLVDEFLFREIEALR
jgi:hypothetical protein